jgi:hypothetical protein
MASPNVMAHPNSSEIFQLRFNLILSEKIIQYSKTFTPQLQTSWHIPIPLKVSILI